MAGSRELTVDAARRLCDGRLVVEHEGGYSAELVPFCGLAIVEAMSGITTECTGTILHEFPAHLGGQELQPHQAAVIDAVAALFDAARAGRGSRRRSERDRARRLLEVLLGGSAP